MTFQDWEQVKYFSRQDIENLGDADRYQPPLIFAIDHWRENTGLPFIVNPYGGTLGKHSENSLHYTAEAIDFTLIKINNYTLLDVFISLSRYPFTEIGVYPDFEYNGFRNGGFHVGLDPDNPLNVRPRKLWLKRRDHDYEALTQRNLLASQGPLKG